MLNKIALRFSIELCSINEIKILMFNIYRDSEIILSFFKSYYNYRPRSQFDSNN